jgi:hypothetical protein
VVRSRRELPVEPFLSRLDPIPLDSMATGYRPDRDVSNFIFITRALAPSRVQKAFLSIEGEQDNVVVAKSPLGALYPVERSALVASLRTQLYQRANRVLLPDKPVVQQLVQLLANLFARWYPLHGVWSFLPSGNGGLASHHSVPHAV